MARALAAAVAASLLAVSGAGGAPVQTPKRGGTVVIGVPSPEISCVNLLYGPCDIDAPFLLGQTLEGAFDVDYTDLTYRPNLVSQVTYTRKPPFTLTYRIRPEARWSDGTAVTAADFVFTWRAASRGGVDPSWLGDFAKVRSVRAVDAKTFKVVLPDRFAAWRELFPFVLPRHALAGQDLTAIWRHGIDDPRTGRPIGSGPFLLSSIERRGRDVVFVRNPAYWGPHKAYLDRVVLRAFPPGEDPAKALRHGEVDIVPGGGQLRGTPGVTVLTVLNTWLEHLSVRVGPGGHPALRSKLVRRALAYGIDRAAILRSVPPGARLLDNVVFFANSRFYAPNWAGYRYRPAEARRLLELAGCQPGADGIYACGGERLSLRVVTTAGNPVREAVLELVQRQLLGAGVEAVPAYVVPPALGQLLSSGGYDVALFRYLLGPDPGGRVEIFGCGKSLNVTGYCSRLVTGDLDESERILDAGLRAELLNRVDRQLSRAVPVLPLYQAPGSLAFKAALRGVSEDFVWKSEDWWLER